MSLERLSAALGRSYRFEREIGAGGMATVYLAEDLKHHRKVAIKVLRPELAAVIGAERFLVEIRTTANLQHPHILALIDSGDTEGMLWYVMPFVEGESLRDRLTREKQLPVNDAVRVATEVAGALDYAHRHNVIHRDIKPENILLHDGSALVADFGIALAASSGAGTRMTETGMSLGTPHYMSPEQAMGEREITARSDVYALGCITYEMLVGEPPFNGPTAQAIIARVMTEEPRALTMQRKSVPPNVEAAVFTALEKLPADRYATAAEFATALTDIGTTSRRTTTVMAHASASGPRRFLWPVAATLLGAAALWGWLRPETAALPSRQRVVLWSAPFSDFLNPSTEHIESRVAISPDGNYIVFADSTGNDTQLFLKERNQIHPVPIAGTEGAGGPFFSPDGQWIGYLAPGGVIRKVRVTGGGSITLASEGNATYRVATWLDNDVIVFTDKTVGMSQVPGEGGPVTQLRAPRANHGDDMSSLTPLPGGRGVLFTGCPGNCASGSTVYAYDIEHDTTIALVPDATGGWYSPTGHLLYVGRTGGLFAVGFDLTRMAITSGAISVADSVAPNGLAFSASGVALLTLGTEDFKNSNLVWIARDGSEEPVDPDWVGNFEYPALAPDGRTLAVSVRDAITRLWVRRADGSRIQVAHSDLGSWRPNFTPDGRNFSFITATGATSDAGANDVYLSPVDGGTAPRLLVDLQPGVWEAEVSRDGEWLVLRVDDAASYGVMYARRLRGDTTLSMLYSDSSFNTQVSLSPDSKWLAFSSNKSGRTEVYVASFPDMQVKYPVSQGGGTEPRWSNSGQELFFKSRGKMMALPFSTGTGFAPGSAKPLFSVIGLAEAINRRQYDVSPDDRRFLMIRRPDTRAQQEVVMVENFFTDLKAKVKR
ncbi:MAG: protein kinase [Gemmatimonadales bacterium]|nr:protein kinase [Gemmatimonadales bacterium]MDZ4390710.1 protein kinase [Gemmatimonadales bacterium]